MSTLDVTWARAARVWWIIAWRSLVACVAGGSLVGLFAGVFKAVTGALLLPDQHFN